MGVKGERRTQGRVAGMGTGGAGSSPGCTQASLSLGTAWVLGAVALLGDCNGSRN